MKKVKILLCASLILVQFTSCDPNHAKKFSRIDEDDINGYEEFIQKYPSSTLVEEARNRISTAKQKKWIYDNLPKRVWDDLASNAINNEYQRLVDLITDYGNSSINRYYNKERETDRARASLYGSGYYDESFSTQVYAALLGIETAAGARNRRDSAINAYKKRHDIVKSNLKSSFENCLSYKDSTIVDDYQLYSDQEICEMLLGRVTSKPTSNSLQSYDDIAQSATKRILSGMLHPVISSCTYNEGLGFWVVRLDHADNHYVKFFPRDDGDFDIEYNTNPGQWSLASLQAESSSGNRDDVSMITRFYEHVLGISLDEWKVEDYLSSGLAKRLWTEDYDGCYQIWLFRTGYQDGPEDYSKILSVNQTSDGWYEVKYLDMGHPGKTKVHVSKGRIDDFKRLVDR